MWWQIIILTILSAILYRLGGWGDEGRKKFPKLPGWLFNTKARDIGCALVSFIGMKWVIGIAAPWWIHLISFLILFGMLTTYWDWIWNNWDNFWLHGFMCGFAYIPYAIYDSSLWMAFGIRCVVMAVFMGVWCHVLFSNDVVEETGRGGIITASLPLFLIG